MPGSDDELSRSLSRLDVLIVPWGRLGDQIAARAAAEVLGDAWKPKRIRIRWLVSSSSVIQTRQLSFEPASVALSRWRVVAAAALDRRSRASGPLFRLGHMVVAFGVRLDRVRRILARRRFIGNADFALTLDRPTGRVEMNVCQVSLAQAEFAARRLGAVTLKDPPSGFDDWLAIVRADNCICVHVRLGDVYRIEGIREQRGLLSPEYWREAFRAADVASGVNERKTLVIFSDEPEAAKKRLRLVELDSYNVHVRIGGSAAEDFVLLANARNLVASNSSFSWWAAVFGVIHSGTRAYLPDMASPLAANQISETWVSIPADWEIDEDA